MFSGSFTAEQGTGAQLDRESQSLRSPETRYIVQCPSGAARMCRVPLNKELTTAHAWLMVYLTLSGSGPVGDHRVRESQK